MEWIRAHQYASGFAAAGLLVVAGVFFVESRTPVPSTPTTAAWSGTAPLSYSAEPAAQSQTPQTPEQIASEVIQNQAPPGLALPGLAVSTSATTSSPSGPFDYVALLAELTASSSVATPSSTQTDSGNSAIAEAYQFIPQGLIATTAAAPASTMSASEETLYNYGNEVGATIQSFEREHSDETEVLKDQAEDRSDPTKAAALVSLGQALAGIGARMNEMNDVPQAAASLHAALAQSYENIGAKLELVAQAQSDADFVQAIENYDSAADTFVANYAALATFFSAQGVVFASQDPGSVFSFTDASASGL